MKKIILFSVITALYLSSCNKHHQLPETFTQVEVNRDCTGTYITINYADYWVCNHHILDSYADGATLQVSYTPTANCMSPSDVPACNMYHSYNGFVTIVDIQ